jgi:hypothetical protein
MTVPANGDISHCHHGGAAPNCVAWWPFPVPATQLFRAPLDDRQGLYNTWFTSWLLF